jgi:hypothetical protein
MPGELGNETESQEVGYREQAYKPQGELPSDPDKDKKPRSDMIRRVMEMAKN